MKAPRGEHAYESTEVLRNAIPCVCNHTRSRTEMNCQEQEHIGNTCKCKTCDFKLQLEKKRSLVLEAYLDDRPCLHLDSTVALHALYIGSALCQDSMCANIG